LLTGDFCDKLMASTAFSKPSRPSRTVEKPVLRSRGKDENVKNTEWHDSLAAVWTLAEDGVLEDLHQYIIFTRLSLNHSKGSSCQAAAQQKTPEQLRVPLLEAF